MDLRVLYTETQVHDTLIELQSVDVLCIPMVNHVEAHPLQTTTTFLLITPLTHAIDTVYVIPGDHADFPYNGIAQCNVWNHTGTVYTLYKKDLLYASVALGKRAIDVAGLEYLRSGVHRLGVEYPKPLQDITKRCGDTHANVPLMMVVEYAEQLLYRAHRVYWQYTNEHVTGAFKFHNTVVIPALWGMERAKIHVDPVVFRDHYPAHIAAVVLDDTYTYTQYNPYTSTGRIGGRFRGLMTSAIPKATGARSAYTSRFGPTGSLLLVDFESFHLRLIADAIKFPLPDIPVHTFLAQQYFNTTTVTPEQYAAGKLRTFQLLYDDEQTVDHIPFFVAVRNYVAQVWCEFQRDGFVVSQSGRIIWKAAIEDPSPKKIFNYLFQLREMEVAMQGIYRLLGALYTMQSCVTIYTYDSVLIDCHPAEREAVLRFIRILLPQQDKFPVRIAEGATFHEMTPI